MGPNSAQASDQIISGAGTLDPPTVTSSALYNAINHQYDNFQRSLDQKILSIVPQAASKAVLPAIALNTLKSSGDSASTATGQCLIPPKIGFEQLPVKEQLLNLSELRNPQNLLSASLQKTDINILGPQSIGKLRIATEAFTSTDDKPSGILECISHRIAPLRLEAFSSGFEKVGAMPVPNDGLQQGIPTYQVWRRDQNALAKPERISV